MLTRDSLEVAHPLASVLDANRLVVVPVEGTPLDELVKATRSDPNFCTDDGKNGFNISLPDVEYIANAKDPVLNVSQHDTVMDNVVEVVSSAVKEHMVFARNVVAPAIEDLVVKTTTSLNELSPSSLLGMEVVVWNPPKPLENSSLETAVRKFEDVAYDVPALNMRLPDITASEIVDLMKSGSGGLDSDIAEWAAIKGESFFINIWNNVFQIKQNELSDRTAVTFRDYIYSCEDEIDNALCIYLLSRKLMDNPLPNTEMNINVFNNTIVEFRNQSAAKLCRVFDELEKINKAQQLVRYTTNRLTCVNGSIYAKWIEAGGENEVLFGNLLNLPAKSLVNDINAVAAALKASWDHHALLVATVERNKVFTRTKELLMHHFRDQMRMIEEGEEATVGNREIVLKLFGEYLDRVREDELKDIWTVCLKLICRSRFYRTEAERILLGIERIKKENPEIAPREAAAISMIEYVAYWLSTQFKVKAV